MHLLLYLHEDNSCFAENRYRMIVSALNNSYMRFNSHFDCIGRLMEGWCLASVLCPCRGTYYLFALVVNC